MVKQKKFELKQAIDYNQKQKSTFEKEKKKFEKQKADATKSIK